MFEKGFIEGATKRIRIFRNVDDLFDEFFIANGMAFRLILNTLDTRPDCLQSVSFIDDDIVGFQGIDVFPRIPDRHLPVGQEPVAPRGVAAFDIGYGKFDGLIAEETKDPLNRSRVFKSLRRPSASFSERVSSR